MPGAPSLDGASLSKQRSGGALEHGEELLDRRREDLVLFVDGSQRTEELFVLDLNLSQRLLADVPGLRCLLPQAGMFMLVDVRGTGLSANEFAWGLLRETGVSVLDGQAFGPSAAGFVRLGFVVQPERLQEACRRIARYCRSIAATATALQPAAAA